MTNRKALCRVEHGAAATSYGAHIACESERGDWRRRRAELVYEVHLPSGHSAQSNIQLLHFNVIECPLRGLIQGESNNVL